MNNNKSLVLYKLMFLPRFNQNSDMVVHDMHYVLRIHTYNTENLTFYKYMCTPNKKKL